MGRWERGKKVEGEGGGRKVKEGEKREERGKIGKEKSGRNKGKGTTKRKREGEGKKGKEKVKVKREK